jgi:hypothetical protein
MPRVVPSQVLAYIDSLFPDERIDSNNLGRGNAGELAGLIDLIERIPEELLTMDSKTYSQLISSKAHIRERLASWSNDRSSRGMLDFVKGKNPVLLVRQALAECPDEPLTPATSKLTFLADSELAANLRNDIGVVDRALSNGEWKAATVLAGSVIEALLLWALQQRDDTHITAAIRKLTAAATLTSTPNQNLDRWDLNEYIEVSAELGVIKPDTAKQARLAREFRNLIHPGRAQRLGQKCDRATALSAVAGVEHIVRDLGS